MELLFLLLPLALLHGGLGWAVWSVIGRKAQRANRPLSFWLLNWMVGGLLLTVPLGFAFIKWTHPSDWPPNRLCGDTMEGLSIFVRSLLSGAVGFAVLSLASLFSSGLLSRVLTVLLCACSSFVALMMFTEVLSRFNFGLGC